MTSTKNVYGNSGNRWWVGLNVGETGGQSTVFGQPSSLFIGKPGGYESLPSGNAKDDIQFANAARADHGAASPVTISVENVKWYNIQGPYATQSAANAAIPAIQKAHPAPGEVAQAAKNLGVSNPLAAVEAFIGDLSSANTWIRVAKIGIGGAILLVGIAKLTGFDNKIGGIVKKLP